jgi:hypothetical protein
MSKCDEKTIDANAKRTLELIEKLDNRDTNIDIKYETFNEEREKNINSIMDCHDTIMEKIQEDIANKPEGDAHNGADFEDIKTFETLIATQLASEVEKYTPIETDATNLNDQKSTLVKQLYDIDTEISSYTKQTDKINADINNNTGSIESSDGKITIMYYGNYIVLGFVILSLFYINFKYLFIKKVNPLTKEKTKSLFSLKNDKKQIETINNETRMKKQEQLLTT